MGAGGREKGRKRKRGTRDPASLDLKPPGWRREEKDHWYPHGEWAGPPPEGPPWPCPYGQTSISLLNRSSLRYPPYPQGTRRPGQRSWTHYLQTARRAGKWQPPTLSTVNLALLSSVPLCWLGGKGNPQPDPPPKNTEGRTRGQQECLSLSPGGVLLVGG